MAVYSFVTVSLRSRNCFGWVRGGCYQFRQGLTMVSLMFRWDSVELSAISSRFRYGSVTVSMGFGGAVNSFVTVSLRFHHGVSCVLSGC